MAKTVAVYQDTDAGRVRVGLFTYRGIGQSVYAISQAFHTKYPKAHTVGQLYIARRSKLNGQWVDDKPLPMDNPVS